MTRTQIKTVCFPSLVTSICSPKSCIKIVWSYFRLNIACNDERQSVNIRNKFYLEQQTYLRAKRIARKSAVNLELYLEAGLRICLVLAATAATPSSVFEPSVKIVFFFWRRIFYNKLEIEHRAKHDQRLTGSGQPNHPSRSPGRKSVLAPTDRNL